MAVKLFHIDFGHFLGNWKSKLGVRRERVKFILTPDFVHAFTNGEGQKSDNWKRFKDECAKAYQTVRSNANVFINLLNMMLCCGLKAPLLVCLSHYAGITELQSHEDVNYLRETLCLNMSDEEARENFMQEVWNKSK